MRRYRLRRDDGTFLWITEIYESVELNPDHTPQTGGWTIPPKSTYGYGGDVVSTDSLSTESINNKQNTDFANELDQLADIQEIAQIIKIDLGGNGDQARIAKRLYFQHPDLSLHEIAELAVGVDFTSEKEAP